MKKKPPSQKITQLISAAITIAGPRQSSGPGWVFTECHLVREEKWSRISRTCRPPSTEPPTERFRAKSCGRTFTPQKRVGRLAYEAKHPVKTEMDLRPFFSATSSSKRSLPVSGGRRQEMGFSHEILRLREIEKIIRHRLETASLTRRAPMTSTCALHTSELLP